MVTREMLHQISAFEELNAEQMEMIQTCCDEVNLKNGDKVFGEGEAATHLWFVVNGQVDLRFELPDQRPTSDEHTVRSIKVEGTDPAAKTLGWSCFVPPHKFRLSAYCASEASTLIRINKDDLTALFEKEPLVGYHFMSYMVTVVGGRFQRFQDKVTKMLGERVMSGW